MLFQVPFPFIDLSVLIPKFLFSTRSAAFPCDGTYSSKIHSPSRINLLVPLKLKFALPVESIFEQLSFVMSYNCSLWLIRSSS